MLIFYSAREWQSTGLCDSLAAADLWFGAFLETLRGTHTFSTEN